MASMTVLRTILMNGKDIITVQRSLLGHYMNFHNAQGIYEIILLIFWIAVYFIEQIFLSLILRLVYRLSGIGGPLLCAYNFFKNIY